MLGLAAAFSLLLVRRSAFYPWPVRVRISDHVGELQSSGIMLYNTNISRMQRPYRACFRLLDVMSYRRYMSIDICSPQGGGEYVSMFSDQQLQPKE